MTADPRLQEIKDLNPAAGVISQFDYTYDAAGRITGWTLANSGEAQSNQYALGYDAASQLNSATLQSGGSIVHQYAFGYDAASNRTTQQTDMMVTTATPNNLNQLTSLAAGGQMHFIGTVNKPGTTVTVAGNAALVDAQGNFNGVAQVAPGTNTVPIVATDPSGNTKTNTYQVTIPGGAGSTLTYDLNGNLTTDAAGQTYEYDAANRVTAINESPTLRTEFKYDGLGRRVSIEEKTSGTVTSTK